MFHSGIPRRRGFTVLQLLVAVAIIGTLLALLVPAVQKARELAGRSHCQNNLHQIGIALHSFHDTKGGFPPARWTRSAAPKPKVNVHWIPYLFPFIGQEELFKEYDFNVSFGDTTNNGVNQTRIPLLECPSAPQGRNGRASRAITDYSGTVSVQRPNPFLDPVPPVDKTFLGVLGLNVNRKIEEVLDGTSNTLIVAEDAGQDQQWVMGQMVNPIGGNGGWADSNNLLNIAGFNPVTVSTPGLCAVNCYNKTEIYSFHPGGANALFADGGVRFLFEQVDLNVVVSWFTRAGGEAIPPLSY